MRWLPALCLACAPAGPELDTRIDDLRVISVVVSPPEFAAGDRVAVTVEVLDPHGEPYDVLGWWCTLLGGGCAEAGLVPTELDTWTFVSRDVDDSASRTFVVPDALPAVPPDLETVPATFWALACRPGACAVIDDVAARPGAGSSAWGEAVQQLEVPGGWIRDVPRDQGSLAWRTVLLSSRAPEERNESPTLTWDRSPPAEVAPGASVAMAVRSTGAQVHPFTTAGAFTRVAVEVDNARAQVMWEAPEQPGPAELVVVAEDFAGGSAVLRADVQVR